MAKSLTRLFDNAENARESQDVGLDGMSDEVERVRLASYLSAIEAKFGNTTSPAYQQAFADPSGDNYLYPRDPIYDGQDALVLQRYKRFNGFEGNSTLDKLEDGTPKSGITIPDDEDIKPRTTP